MHKLIRLLRLVKKMGLPMAMLVLVSLVSIDSIAGVNIKQGKWRDGKVVWYFNSDQMPASLKEDEFVALTTRAFGIWSAGCNLTVQYGGTTSVAADNAQAIAANKVVVGFAHLPSGVGGDAGPFSTDSASNSYYFTAGVVQISADNTPYNLASDRLLYILVHEIGHLLNLAHSDEPYSVMYAYPYVAIQSATEPYKVYADDISTCANLYGARSLQTSRDYGADPFSADAKYGLTTGVGNINSNGGVTIATGSAQDTWQPGNPHAVDLSLLENFPWLRVGWLHPAATAATVRIIAPSGDIVLDNYSVFTGPSSIPDGYFPFRWGIYINGAWKMQAFVDGKPAAETLFNITNGVSSPPKLEVAAIAESGGAGSMALRVANYSPVGIASSVAYLNGDYARTLQTFSLAGGNNTIELWAESNLPRYRAGSGCGQPASSSDLTRQVVLSANTRGNIVSDRIDVSESGTLIAYSSKANIQSGATGAINVYVVGLFRDVLLFRQSNGAWTANQAPLFSFVAPGAANFDIVRDLDTRGLPPGTTIMVGYGAFAFSDRNVSTCIGGGVGHGRIQNASVVEDDVAGIG
ncbi:MAG: matrixin family metalloprotease [Proteobacteria bacterium]|nr:matrixin family metalloprotease [Pseudomonadota bacterium]